MIKLLLNYFKEWFVNIWQLIRLHFKSNLEKDLEIIALRSQLALYIEHTKSKKITKPRSTLAFRQLWILLSKINKDWKSKLYTFNPRTVIGWHNNIWKGFWRRKTRKVERPTLSKETIKLIKKIHKDNPLLSPEKIHEQLVLLCVNNPPAPNTIAKYIPKTRKSPTEKQVQSWKTFLKNHLKFTWGADFLLSLP